MNKGKEPGNSRRYNIKDISNQRFGRLTAVKFSHISKNKAKSHYWLYKCDCGKEKILNKSDVSKGNSRSCGCLLKDIFTTHGLTNSRIYQSWESMKKRCLNKKNKFYKNYGGRGITICKSWLESFESFLNDMGQPPTNKHTIDRIDNDGNYEPSNCRWITKKEQCNNKSNNLKVVFRGETKSLQSWCDEFGLKYSTEHYHFRKGRSLEYILKLRGKYE